jgi:hypothetical protein
MLAGLMSVGGNRLITGIGADSDHQPAPTRRHRLKAQPLGLTAVAMLEHSTASTAAPTVSVAR